MGRHDLTLNEAEAELLRAEDELQCINAARQKPFGQQVGDVSIMQRGYEAARERRDFIEREVWRLKALAAARKMEEDNAA